MTDRNVWDSRIAFVLASIGSAIGLGNLWRFPYVNYEYGVGAFLVAYAICLLLAGIPLLMLEFSIGKKMNSAAPGAFRGISKRLEWLGWFAAGIGFIICSYYSAIMSYLDSATFDQPPCVSTRLLRIIVEKPDANALRLIAVVYFGVLTQCGAVQLVRELRCLQFFLAWGDNPVQFFAEICWAKRPIPNSHGISVPFAGVCSGEC